MDRDFTNMWQWSHVSDFIKKNASLINKNEFEDMYDNMAGKDTEFTYIITELLYTSKIDPLKHMDVIPSYYLCYSNMFESFTIPDNIEAIGYRAFARNSRLKKIIIPKSVAFISSEVFSDCNLNLTIYYRGSKYDWNNIHKEDNINANIEFNYTGN